MRSFFLFAVFLVVVSWSAQGQRINQSIALPDSIYSGKQGAFHVQGVAIDEANGHVYFSFTNKLIKMDLSGNLIGSVTGFSGHLGDLDFNTEDGKIYGSLEYKNDAIGKGISNKLGVETTPTNGFYIAIFDGARIIRPDMNAESEDLLRTVYLQEPVKDYEATVQVGKEVKSHRFACSGIDGVTFGPSFGKEKDAKRYLYVAYGVYGDTDREDNDHQVILKYDIAKWDRYGQHLAQGQLHRSGPAKPMEKYFVKTGSTRYGIQNLAYDPHTGNFFAAVYRGVKPQYPNYDLFVIDGHKKSQTETIYSDNKKIKVKTLSLLEAGPEDPKTGIRGWHFKWGATGLHPLGNGLFYISHNKKTKEGQQQTTIYKYKWVGDRENAFVLADE